MTVSDYPNTWPAATFDFRNSNQLDPRITFTRATTGTYINNGLVVTAPINVPRFQQGVGLLVEESRANIQLTSANPITSGGQFLTWVTGLDAPDGSTDAVRIVATADDEIHNITSTIFPNAMNLVDHAWSCFARPEGVNRFTLRNPENGFCTFELTGEGTVFNPNTEPATITPVGGGWYRCTVTGTPGTVAYQYNITLNADDEVGQGQPFLGDGTSGIRFWGWQMEEGTFSTSYIPTTTAAVTRAPEQAVIQGTDFTQLWNTSNGSWVAAGGPTYDITDNASFVRVDADSSAFSMTMNLKAAASPDDNYLQGAVKETSTSSWNMTSPNIYGDYKVAMTWEATPDVTATISVDGNSLTRATGLELDPAINKMQIGSYRGQFNHISQVASVHYYTSTFTTDQLEAMTTQ